MIRARRALAMPVVLAVVLAGCGAPVGGPAPASEPTDRLTAAPVPTASAIDDRTAYPPGITGAGVDDPVALKDAHVAQLRDGGFTLRRVTVERYANGSLRARTELTATYPGDGRYRIVRTFEGPDHDRLGTGGTTVQYGNESGGVRVRRAPNGTVVDRSPAAASSGAITRTALLTAPFSGRRILLMLRAVDVDTVDPIEGRDGYRIEGSGIDDAAALRSLLSPSFATDVWNATVAAVVTEEGLVEQLRFAYDTVRDGESVRVVVTFRYAVDDGRAMTPANVTAANVTADRDPGVRSLDGPAGLW